jgi:hypothetical protein
MARLNLTTPKGTAIWPKLNEPDRKFQPEGVYSVRLRLPDSDAEDFLDQLKRIVEESYEFECKKQGKAKLKRAPEPWGVAQDYDSDKEEKIDLEGFTEIRFNMKAEVSTRSGKKWTQRPALFDARLNPLPEDSEPIGGGSVIRISAEVYPWYTASLGFGVSLRPRGVQVLDLKSSGSSSPESLGFEKEDGYESPTLSSVTQDADDSDF